MPNIYGVAKILTEPLLMSDGRTFSRIRVVEKVLNRIPLESARINIPGLKVGIISVVLKKNFKEF